MSGLLVPLSRWGEDASGGGRYGLSMTGVPVAAVADPDSVPITKRLRSVDLPLPGADHVARPTPVVGSRGPSRSARTVQLVQMDERRPAGLTAHEGRRAPFSGHPCPTTHLTCGAAGSSTGRAFAVRKPPALLA
jgi:hypothetical protein